MSHSPQANSACDKYPLFNKYCIYPNASDSNVKKHICQGKMHLSKSETNPKNKMSAKKKYFTINCLHLTHRACPILSTFINQGSTGKVLLCLKTETEPASETLRVLRNLTMDKVTKKEVGVGLTSLVLYSLFGFLDP